MTAPSLPPASSPAARFSPKRVLLTLIKIIIAVVGIWFVARMISWNDTATLPANGKAIRQITFPQDVPVTVLQRLTFPPPRPGRPALHTVEIAFPTTPVAVEVDGHAATLVIDKDTNVPGLNEPLDLPHTTIIPLDYLKLEKGERIHEGLRTLLIRASARWYLLVMAWAILVTPFLVSAIRWRALLRPQGIYLSLGKSLQLTFVGQFYSILLPGITGGDLVKIVYAARLTGSKTKSFITVILDRVLGLIALMCIAGTAAAVQLVLNHRAAAAAITTAPAVNNGNNTLFNVLLLIIVLLGGILLSGTVYFSRRLRRLVGIDAFMATFAGAGQGDGREQRRKLERLFRIFNIVVFAAGAAIVIVTVYFRDYSTAGWARGHQPQLLAGLILGAILAFLALGGLLLHNLLVDRALPAVARLSTAVVRIDETVSVYRGHFGLLFWAFLISLVSQLTLPISAWLAGIAFGMHANIGYFFAYVPIAVLASSLPISPPQGFGFLDYIIYHFFAERGTATASQAIAVAQAVRFLPILWNLVGAYWVVRGSYSRHELVAEERVVLDDSDARSRCV